MSITFNRSSLSSALLLVGALAFGCGDDDEDGTEPSIDGGPMVDAGAGDGGPAQPSIGPVVRADGKMDLFVVLAAPSGDMAAPNYVVEVLDNDTGAPLSITGTSNAQGKLTLSGLPAGKKVGLKIVGQLPTSVDSVSFNYPLEKGGGEETLRAVPKSSSDIVPTLALFTPMADKGPISGAVYFWKPNNTRGIVGCATIKVDNNAGEPIRYFGAMNLPQAGVTNTSPLNGRYYVGNMNTGKQTIRAYDSTGKEIGSVTLPVLPRSTGQASDISLIASIYVDADATPANCTQGMAPP